MKVEISTEKIEAGILMLLKGEVHINPPPDVRTSLGEVFRQKGPRALLINLSGVRYMDSSGIATLVEAMQNCMKSGMRLRLVSLSPSVRDVFEMARLASVFDIVQDADAALAGL
jgi:anti-sigma B factor antagonist